MAAKHVFISYAHEDRDFVEDLAARLSAEGVPVWYDKSLRGGQPWPRELARRIDAACALVVVVTPAACASDWVEKEIIYAQNLQVPIVPYRLVGDLALPLANLQYVTTEAELLAALDVLPIPRSPPIPPNPFVPLTGRVDDPRLFFDREREIRQVFEILNSGSSVALIGERAVGKSSLLGAICRQAENRLRPPRRPVYLNLQLVCDEEDFYDALCEQAGFPTCKGYALARALRDRRLLLALDEVEKMTWEGFTRQVRDQLRGLAEGHDSPLRLILAARTPLDRLFPDSQNEGMTSPLAGVCLQVDVGMWNEATARTFIAARLAFTPVRFTDEEIACLMRKSHGHPQRLMRLCHQLYAHHVEQLP